MDVRTQQLLDRTFYFGVNVLKFMKKLPYDSIYKIPKFQVARSSASIGANYEEAQGAVSKRDFSNKVGISYKEARESAYWLRVLKELYNEKKYEEEFTIQIMEAIELRNIFSSIKNSCNKDK
jgi:four helix bundle protein